MFELLTGFINALINTLIFAYVARFLIARSKPDRPANFGAFCLAIGLVVGRYSGSAESGAEAALTAARFIGAALALWLIWFRWFRRRADA